MPTPEDGLKDLRRGPCFLLVSAPLADSAQALGLLDPGGLERMLAIGGGAAGRAPTSVIELPGRRERLHLRPVRHGGWLGGLWGDRVLGLERPIAELRAAAQLRAAGAPVVRPALVAARRRVGPLWSAAVGTLHEDGGVDARVFLSSGPPPSRLLRAASAAGAAVRRLHEAGGLHGDLHLGNLLVCERGDTTRVLIADLDGARIVPEPAPRLRMAELMRLYRSAVKLRLTGLVGPRVCARFLAAYTDGDRALRVALLARLPRERTRLALHRLGYSAALGRGSGRRSPATRRREAARSSTR